MKRDLHQANRLSWNAATVAHNSHKGDQAAFFRAGGSTLFPEERELLGEVAGLRIAHLQCNAGQDTLSLARLGADVVGVDISDEAIDFARRLAAESGIAARFDRADVYDWLDAAAGRDERFDVVFESYGVLCWLSDLRRWARGVAAVLRRGGRVVVIDFHPMLSMFDAELRLTWPYSSGGRPLEVAEGIGDYVGQARGATDEFRNPHPTYEFPWGIAEVLQALIDAGLRITTVREYPHSNGYAPFRGMIAGADGRWHLPEGFPEFPLMFGLVAANVA